MSLKRSLNQASFIIPYTVLAAGMALSTVFMASIVAQAANTPTPTGTPTIFDESGSSDFILPPTDEGRAQFGNSFVGEVISFVGEEQIPTSDPEEDYRVYIYDVRVEQTLTGDASGQARIKLDDPSGLPDAQTLSVGERYLFFAGYDPATDRYPVDPVVGVLPIENDRQAVELVATFEPLIRQAERRAAREASLASGDPCEQPSQEPIIAVQPQQGRPGDQVRVTGGPFIRAEVPVSWDGKDGFLTAALVAPDCTIDVMVTIPQADAGEHRILVYDAGGNQDTVRFDVTND